MLVILLFANSKKTYRLSIWILVKNWKSTLELFLPDFRHIGYKLIVPFLENRIFTRCGKPRFESLIIVVIKETSVNERGMKFHFIYWFLKIVCSVASIKQIFIIFIDITCKSSLEFYLIQDSVFIESIA